MRNYLVVDVNRERALERIKKINHPEEMENYAENEHEAIAFYENKKYFITNQVPSFIEMLSLHGIHLHRDVDLSQEVQQSIYNSMIKTYGLMGLDPDSPHIQTY